MERKKIIQIILFFIFQFYLLNLNVEGKFTEAFNPAVAQWMADYIKT